MESPIAVARGRAIPPSSLRPGVALSNHISRQEGQASVELLGVLPALFAGLLVAWQMALAGHALWLPNQVEWAWNRDTGIAAERAALQRKRLWDDDACGSGPSAGAQLELVVNWDADLVDHQNINDEWIRIAHDSSLTVWLQTSRSAGVGSWGQVLTVERRNVIVSANTAGEIRQKPTIGGPWIEIDKRPTNPVGDDHPDGTCS